jgi:hypothetical protein
MKLTDTCGFKRSTELCVELVYSLSCSVSLCAARLAMSLLGVELKLSTRGIAVPPTLAGVEPSSRRSSTLTGRGIGCPRRRHSCSDQTIRCFTFPSLFIPYHHLSPSYPMVWLKRFQSLAQCAFVQHDKLPWATTVTNSPTCLVGLICVANRQTVQNSGPLALGLHDFKDPLWN